MAWCRAPSEFSPADLAMLAAADGLPDKARAAMEDFALHTMLAEIWRVVGDANRYFASEEPWVKRKTDPERFATVLYVTAEVLRAVAIMAQPVLTRAAGKLLDLLGIEADARSSPMWGRGTASRRTAYCPRPAHLPALCGT